MSKRSIFLALPVAAALVLSACGGGDAAAERPSADEVATAMTESAGDMAEGIPSEAIDCIAQALVDSDLSDETLRAMVDDPGYQPAEDEMTEITEVTTDAAMECVTG